MNIKTMSNVFTRTLGRTILKTKTVSPQILVATGVASVVATAVLASRATLKLEPIIDDTNDYLRQANERAYASQIPLDRREVAYIYLRSAGKVAKLYAPALIVGGITITSILGSHSILQRRNVALMAAYGALETAYDTYRDRVRTLLGEESEREIFERVDHKEVTPATEEEEAVTVPRFGSPYAKFFDDASPYWKRFPGDNAMFVKVQQNWANEKLAARGHLFLNEVYEMLGLAHTKEGAVVGWLYQGGGDNYVDFGLFDATDERKRAFVNGDEYSVLLDFNVDGVIFDKI